MKEITEFAGNAVVMTFLMVLIVFSVVGIVAATEPQPADTLGHPGSSIQVTGDMMDNCCQPGTGNGTTFYGPGMMGPAGAQMMESVEVSAMGQSMHDEMQGLVTKMMAGSLSSSDRARMVEIMNQYPGASNMMMTRLGDSTGQGWSGYPGMMGTGEVFSGAGMMGGAGMMNAGFMSLGVILVVLFFVVWLVVGILLIIWLVKKLQKDNK